MDEKLMQAVIMAGGKGSRLKPYTTILPKPLMPIGEIPILEIILRQLKHNGFKRITLAVGYLAELIQAYFGDGDKWGLEIEYSRERKNLGTIGPLTLIEKLDDTFLVMNGDILTNLNYQTLISSHKKSGNLVTIASYNKEVKIDLGVMEVDEKSYLTNYIEKPNLSYRVSMGIYVMNKEVLEFIPQDIFYDVPNLMMNLLKSKKPPQIYSFDGIWLDIGRKEDYERASENFQENLSKFLPE
jgi:NDP-sugar pyrophosphorylase family protein